VTIDAGEGVKLRVMRGMIVEVKGRDGQAPANDTKAS
jgi:preprotein translocase subunit YajC